MELQIRIKERGYDKNYVNLLFFEKYLKWLNLQKQPSSRIQLFSYAILDEKKLDAAKKKTQSNTFYHHLLKNHLNRLL